MASGMTRQLGSLCRIYKNSAGKVIALDSVSVNVRKHEISRQKFLVSVDTVDRCRTLLHLTTGGSRVVDSIQSIGNYSSVEENAGNFLVVTWDAKSPDENAVNLSLEKYVSKIGDTV